MSAAELAQHCARQVVRAGPESRVLLSLPGRCRRALRWRFCRGGPWGACRGNDPEAPGRVLVSFRAMEMAAYLAVGVAR